MIFDAKLKNLHKMMEFITDLATKVGFCEKDMHKIQLASEEALVNVISYAYPPLENGKVEILCTFKIGKHISITIKDKGLPFNPLEHCKVNVKASIEERKPGGLGIFFFLKAMDELEYQRKEGCNLLFMKKTLT